jgi:RNA ligase (TIGR02306 family)
MSDWKPQIVRILSVVPHPDADALDIATVNDYPVVVRRDEYKVDDLASYIPIDTILPDDEKFYFLCPLKYESYEENGERKQRPAGPRYEVGRIPEKYRIVKAKKIRGVYSQGLLMPCPDGLKENDSIVEAFGLKKWEEIEEENIFDPSVPHAEKAKKLSLESEPPPVGWSIPHYDVSGIRRFLQCLQDGEEVVLTEKLHGSNAAFVHDGERLWVKSRNLYKRMDPTDMWWGVALRHDLERRLAPAPNVVLFGEVYGQIKGFRYDAALDAAARPIPRVRFFDAWDVAAGRFLSFDARIALLDRLGLDPVPELYRGPWLGKEAMYPLAEGPTTLGGGRHVREGWVLVTAAERFEPGLGARMQVKLVGEGYNLQK